MTDTFEETIFITEIREEEDFVEDQLDLDRTHSHDNILEDDIEINFTSYRDQASWISKFLISWMDDFIFSSFSKYYKSEDVPRAPKEFLSDNVMGIFDLFYNRKKKRLFRSFFTMFWINLLNIQVLHSLNIAINLTLPFVEKFILENIFPTDTTPEWLSSWVGGIFLTLGLGLLIFLNLIIEKIKEEAIYTVNIKLETIMVNKLFDKTLVLSQKSLLETEHHSYASLLTLEVTNAAKCVFLFHFFWDVPLTTALSIFLIFLNVSWPALLIVLVLAVMSPLYLIFLILVYLNFSTFLGNITQSNKVIRNTLEGIRIIKFYAWENIFIKKIIGLRKKMANKLIQFIFCFLLMGSLSVLAPIVVETIMFSALYLFNPADFTVQKIFPSLSYISLFSKALSTFPLICTQLFRSIKSSRKILHFLRLDEIKKFENKKNKEHSIVVNNALFQWGKNTKKHEKMYEKNMKKNIKKEDRKKKKKEKKKKKKNLVGEVMKTLSSPLKKKKKEVKLEMDFQIEFDDFDLKTGHVRMGILGEIDLKIKHKEFCCIVGTLGSGKSSLLQAFIGEMTSLEGSVSLFGKFVFCSEQPWILNETVKNNIILGNEFNSERFTRCVNLVGFDGDIQMFPQGINTEVDELGRMLTMAQKQKICIARTIYHDGEIFFFDDVLAGLSRSSALKIVNDVFLKYLKDKTVVLVTNKFSIVPKADHIIVMEDMKIVEDGKFSELMSLNGRLTKLLKETPIEEEEEKKTKELISIIEEESKVNKKKKKKEKKETSFNELKQSERQVIKEELKSGVVKFSTIWFFFKSFGIYEDNVSASITLGLYLIIDIIIQVLINFPYVWLTMWATNTFEFNDVVYLGTFVGVSIVTIVALFLKYFLLSIFGYLSGLRIHKKVIEKLLYTPVSFFMQNPLGRILNRTARDQMTSDLLLISLDAALLVFYNNLFSFGIMIFTNYMVVIPLLILIPLFVIIQEFFRRSTRQVKRVDSILRSPIISFFHEVVNGIKTIRSFDSEEIFRSLFRKKVDSALRTQVYDFNLLLWVKLRLGAISYSFLLIMAIMIIMFAKFDFGLGFVSFSGLSLLKAFNIAKQLTTFVVLLVGIEKDFNSIERLQEYANLVNESIVYEDTTEENEKEIEKKEEINIEEEGEDEIDVGEADMFVDNVMGGIMGDVSVGKGVGKDGEFLDDTKWLELPDVEFKNVSLKYTEENVYGMKNINFKVKFGEKIAVVGIDGSGKTSLFECLLRLHDHEGKIIVGGVDMNKINLQQYRKHVSYVDQEAFLFKGSIRDNLDPEHKYSNYLLWHCLEKCKMKNYVEGLSNGLDTVVESDARTLSLGQKQLLSLSRFYLTMNESKILVFDSLISNTDVQTVVNEIIKETKEKTIFKVVNNENELTFYDKVMVMKNGNIVGFDAIGNCLKQRKSVLFEILKKVSGKKKKVLKRRMSIIHSNGSRKNGTLPRRSFSSNDVQDVQDEKRFDKLVRSQGFSELRRSNSHEMSLFKILSN